MNKEEKIVPQLRFPEFIELNNWAKNQLKFYLKLLTDFEANGSFSDVKNNVTILDEPDYAWYVRATDLENQTKLDAVKYVDKHSYEFLRKTKLYGGELLITKRGEIGKVYIFDFFEGIKATVAPNMYLLKMNEEAVPRFFYYYFSNYQGNQSLKRLNASSTIGALYKDDVKKLEVYVPTKKEQQKIANCLSSLDEVINAENEKLDLFQDHKKGLLQQLFPVEGETQPKFRFPEFKEDGEWITKPLGDLVEIKGRIGYRGYTTKDIVEKGKGAITLSPSNFDDNGKLIFEKSTYITWEKYYESPEIMLEEGQTVLVKTASVGKSAYVSDLPEKATVNPQIVVLKPKNIAPRFLAFTIFHNYVQNQIKSCIGAGAIPNMSQASIAQIEILLPKDKNQKEQQKIADCLSAADELIEAQTRKIEALQEHKKGLLQQLFPTLSEL